MRNEAEKGKKGKYRNRNNSSTIQELELLCVHYLSIRKKVYEEKKINFIYILCQNFNRDIDKAWALIRSNTVFIGIMGIFNTTTRKQTHMG